MTKTNVLLLALLIGSSLFLVRTAYESRRLFAAIERAKGEERKLEIEYKRLDAERQAQATNLRVERVARERLQMRTVTPGVTHYVTDPAAPAASGTAP
jgi:cell division protein FtsL